MSCKSSSEVYKDEMGNQSIKRNMAQESNVVQCNGIAKGCPYVKKCGGCNMVNDDYAAHLAWKQKKLLIKIQEEK